MGRIAQTRPPFTRSGASFFSRINPGLLRTLLSALFPLLFSLPPSLLAAVSRESLPIVGPYNTYVTSSACVECHKDQHASWHQSYHRTMTQWATTNSVLSPFTNQTVTAEGLLYRVFKKDNSYFAEMPDPDIMMYVIQGGRKKSLSEIPRVERPVVVTTGSHHYQTYWVSSSRHPTVLHSLPLVWLLHEQRWIPREAAFIHGPDDHERFFAQWNNQCIRCHSTGGNPGLNEATGELSTRVAELGIACEACHGPGLNHVQKQSRLQSQPHAPRSSNSTSIRDDTIINPATLPSRAASEICGQCHGEYVHRPEYAQAFATNGPLYTPGDNLHRTRYYIQHPRPGSSAQRWKDRESNPEYFQQRWWPDGTILAAGREYTAMRASECYLKGQISCLHCHSMHESDPDDQLKKSGATSRVCQQCHKQPQYNSQLAQHTHHAAESSGSECMNCHMPHHSYALLKGIRSHQIASPRLDTDSRLQVPNACNLCHLDQTLAWTSSHLRSWYGQKELELNEDQRLFAASALWLIKGDAAQRAITSWHFGWKPAQAISDTAWMPALLSPLLNDDYGVIRQITTRSLQSLNPTWTTNYDFLAAPKVRLGVISNLQTRLPPASSLKTDHRTTRVLRNADGSLQNDILQRLLREQDRRSVTIQE